MVLRPARMTRIGILGLKDDRDRIVTALHDLRILQIEPLAPESLARLAPERAAEAQRQIGDETLRFRGLSTALPPAPLGPPQRFANLEEIFAAAARVPIDAEVGELKREDDRLLTEERTIDETAALLASLAFFPGRLAALRSKSLVAFYGEADREAFDAVRSGLDPADDPTFFTGAGPKEAVRFVVALRTRGAETLVRVAQKAGVRLAAVPNLAGPPGEERARLLGRREEVVARRVAIAERLGALSREWYTTVRAIDEALAIENRKIEALQRFGSGRVAFALEAWIPQRDLPRLETALRSVAGDRVYLYPIPTAEEPPTLMSNPSGVRRFEFFIRFYSLPQASEWDPTLVFAIVFPLFFGFMLGDWGYGLVILLISLWMIRGFPGARYLPKFGRNFVKMIMGPSAMQQLAWALLPGCALAIGLGLFWDEFFGINLLHMLFGYRAPIQLISVVGVGHLLLFAGFIGLGMVTLGFLFGAINEYFHHHPRGVVAKGGGIVFAWGIAFAGLSLIHRTDAVSNPLFDLYLGLTIGGLLLLVFGEGIQNGMMGLIEVVSHILSYTRLVGILLASVILAFVINNIGVGRVHAGGPFAVGWILIGVVILVIGQSFNVILGVFEPGIQGARLIFVEYFSKFYHGNGRAFRAFGRPRERTVSPIDSTAAPSPPPVPAAAPPPAPAP
ncbi:MAG TPA: V-type ATP synthase subunit I [Thermoplasmata archaeon]|nr:V-type ATP synthase subunit I [Thermoplasmata archaeon]